MNTHLNDGQLRADLDGELNANELEHLAECTLCQTRQKEIESQSYFASDKLAFLSAATNNSRLSSNSAWYRFNQQRITQKETSMFKKLFTAPLVRYGVPAVLVLALVFAFPGARAFATKFLERHNKNPELLQPRNKTLGQSALDAVNGKTLPKEQLQEAVLTTKDNVGPYIEKHP